MNDTALLDRHSIVVSDRRAWLAQMASTLGALHTPSLAADVTSPPLAPRTPFGLNLAPVRYWTSERPFNNLFHTASPWFSISKSGQWTAGGVALDEHGWIRRLSQGQQAGFLIDLKAGHPKGSYFVSYRGARGALSLERAVQGNQLVKRDAQLRLTARVTAPVRAVEIRERGNGTAELFHSAFVDRCQRFRCLRFMDWQNTNVDRPVAWSTRVTPNFATQAGDEVALEHMIMLCNLARTDLWYCAHHRATDAYLRQAAELIRQQLHATATVYVEHSNEVWNASFPQHAFCKSQDEHVDAYHLRRTAEVVRVFRDAGLDAQGVLGVHSANSWAATEALKRGLPEEIAATAVAPYFGGRLGMDQELANAALRGGVSQILDACRTEIHTDLIQEIRRQRDLAARWGRKLLAYEGGQHLVGVGPRRLDRRFVQLTIDANRHPGMYELYRDYLTLWRLETNDSLMCLFHSVSEPSDAGCWGLLEYEGQPLATAPKYRAVLDAQQQNA